MSKSRLVAPALFACALSLTSLVPGSARADDDWERERAAEGMKGEFKELAERVKIVAAGAGLDTAKTQAPPWCSAVKLEDVGSPRPAAMARTVESAEQYSNVFDGYFTAAAQACLYPKEKAVQQMVQHIVQSWINKTGVTEAQAIEIIKLNLDADKMKADRDKLCASYKVDDEVDGETRAFTGAVKAMMCEGTWNGRATYGIPDGLEAYMDSNPNPEQLVRLAVILNQVGGYYDADKAEDRDFLPYIRTQVDILAFKPDEALKALDQAPYKGNIYAKATLWQSVGVAKMNLAKFKGALAKRTADADWKELLVTAPQRGIAEWTKLAEEYKTELANSTAFEAKLFGPSKKAMKGCWPQLKADFLKVAKTLDTKSQVAFEDALSHPVASTLFSRLVGCAAVDQDPAYTSVLSARTAKMRKQRGPRAAAYYAALSSLGQILEDRTKFSVKPEALGSMWFSELEKAISDNYSTSDSKIDVMGFVGDDGAAPVKSTKKTKGGIEIQFVTDKIKVMSQSCTPTNRIQSIDTNGNVYYYQNCKDAGLVTVDRTPDPITVPEEWAENIKKGVWIEFAVSRGHSAAERIALPVAVYGDKNKKKLVNWYGFGL
jgi:hypothetical protein